MTDKILSLRRVVEYGISKGKRNVIVDLDVLAAILQISIPIYCEHGLEDGEWCAACSKAMKAARVENGGEE